MSWSLESTSGFEINSGSEDLPAMQQISLIHDLLLAFMQSKTSKNGFVGLQHVPGWTEIYSVVMSKKRALAFLIRFSREGPASCQS